MPRVGDIIKMCRAGVPGGSGAESCEARAGQGCCGGLVFVLALCGRCLLGGIDGDCNADKHGHYPSRAFSMPYSTGIEKG